MFVVVFFFILFYLFFFLEGGCFFIFVFFFNFVFFIVGFLLFCFFLSPVNLITMVAVSPFVLVNKPNTDELFTRRHSAYFMKILHFNCLVRIYETLFCTRQRFMEHKGCQAIVKLTYHFELVNVKGC